ncbi:alpha/beta fold hydrolase [Acidimangrovimonas sediminis]|uniref:alpha/beta fold hydrolase n=1 Tax=Acidimangrovimonas sediminis TaxID=2056283 RepID=UPI000C80633C|nr:alpha/beta hydrolase [Acidimangrovimonas sediminis]
MAVAPDPSAIKDGGPPDAPPADAPFHDDVSEGPAPAHCLWLTARDGVRLRAGFWPEGERGTVLLLPGRTEYVEKYAPAAADFAARGYAMLAIDWRGQGLADRPLAERNMGHVARFADYQNDLQAVIAAAERLDMPRPWYLVGHSMGGAIGLRAIYEGLQIKAAMFSAPMWGIFIPPAMVPVAWGVSTIARNAGLGDRFIPGGGPVTYVADAPFEDNTLTTDRAMFDMMKRQVTTHPELSLGSPSIHWLYEALYECRRLCRRKAPKMPMITFLGMNERIVRVPAVEGRVASWPGALLVRVPGAEHEIMMETPTTRAQFFDAAAELFAAHR